MVSIKNIPEFLGKEVEIAGWVTNYRSSGKIMFLQIRDGSGFMQAVAEKSKFTEEQWADLDKINQEASIKLTGTVQENPRDSFGYELSVSSFEIFNYSNEDYPISNKEHGVDFLMDNRHLWLRSRRQWAILQIRNTIINATYDFFAKEGFIKIDSPILTGSACEGTTELFELNYFDRPAYLSQSGQLYLEAAIFGFGKCFDFGPVFRAEKSKTRRHLTEFWMMDAEMAFYNNEDNMEIQEKLICYIVEAVLNKNRKELEMLERNIEALEKIKAPFIRKTHKEVVEELRAMGSDILDNDDLGADDETVLTKKYDKPIFVMNYPKEVKAFYMKEDPTDPSRVLCADLLAPEGYGEIIGGSQREEDYDKLLGRIRELKLPEETFKWYLDLRKYGSVPHSGFGYGLERIVTWICGLDHLRESIPFARTIQRLQP